VNKTMLEWGEAKRARQMATRSMTRCSCGNIARNGSTLCGTCQSAVEEEDRRREDKDNFNSETTTLTLEQRIERIEQILMVKGVLP